jgi:DNA-binding FadR family transcriptional regulator
MADYLYADIANRIETQIESGELTEGEKLPSERKMSEYYGVSRNVIREALKILSEKGLVNIRSGKGGYVTFSNNAKTMDKLELAICKSKSSLMELLEARKVIELAIAPLAVKKATKEDVLKLRRIYGRMESHRESQTNFAQEDRQFHEELANCTKNKALAVLIATFYNIVDEKLFLVSQLYPERIMRAQREHKAMIDAIEQHNEDAMVKAMSDHMECVYNQLIHMKEKEKPLSVS